jgi:hypothetical protein
VYKPPAKKLKKMKMEASGSVGKAGRRRRGMEKNCNVGSTINAEGNFGAKQ